MPPTANNEASTRLWRDVFERVRGASARDRDEHGVIGSINWLRAHMEQRGANPNVVRNIIYRDKGKLPDKRALFEILDELWQRGGRPPLEAPELRALLAPGSGNEHEVLQLLGREKRRAYRAFVHGVRSGDHPKVVVTGRPGSGKTLLADSIQQALQTPPPAAERIVRLEFVGNDLATALTRLGKALGVPLPLLEAKLVKIGSSSAFAVQADAQADVARLVLDAARRFDGRQVLLLHVSHSLGGQDTLADTALRLNRPDVPRVSAAAWLWSSLFEPLSRLPACALLVSLTDLPARAAQRLGQFEAPLKLTPPTVSEARRFVRARLPDAPPTLHEDIVRRAGRSFDELRTLTLLAEARADGVHAPELASQQSVVHLSQLIETGADEHLRGFLVSLAVLSLPDFPDFKASTLATLLEREQGDLSDLEAAFLDQAPADEPTYRCFSRDLARAVRERLAVYDPDTYRAYHDRAAACYAQAANGDPTGEPATRYLSHRFEARNWPALCAWMDRHRLQQPLVRRIWLAASKELADGPELQRLALRVARHYVARGSYQHQDARDAFSVLSGAEDVDLRVWTILQRVEGLVLRAQFDQGATLLASLPSPSAPHLKAEAALASASIARWRGSLTEAERLVNQDVAASLAEAEAALGDALEAAQEVEHTAAAAKAAEVVVETQRVRAQARMWAGLLAKDRGDLRVAIERFGPDHERDDLMAARMAFQRGDVLMRFGHFDRALEALDAAVELAQRSEALLAEQTRYLARRGTLRRRRGELAAAAADFAAARQVLQGLARDSRALEDDLGDEAEVGFWLARVDDEASLNLLARGRYDEAMSMVERSIGRFRRYASSHGVDATYLVLRSVLRMAVTYGCRGAGQPLRRPFPVGPALGQANRDLEHARRLFDTLIERIESHEREVHLSALNRDTLLAANLFTRDPERALELALQSIDKNGRPYQRAQAHTHAAAATLRAGLAEVTESHLRAACAAMVETRTTAFTGTDGTPERGDLEQVAWITTLAACAALLARDAETAGERLVNGLRRRDLAPFHEMMLHQVACAAERADLHDALRASPLGEALGLYPSAGTHPLRFPDALVLHWRRLGTTEPRRLRALTATANRSDTIPCEGEKRP